MARLPLSIVVLLVALADLAALSGGLAVFVLASRAVPALLPWALAVLPAALWGAAFASVKFTDILVFSHAEDEDLSAASDETADTALWTTGAPARLPAAV